MPHTPHTSTLNEHYSPSGCSCLTNGGRRGRPACWTHTSLLLNLRQWLTIGVAILSFMPHLSL
jgi:hypothetical protein